MSLEAQDLKQKTRKTVGILITIVGLIAAWFYVREGYWAAISAVYGGLISIGLVLLLSWSVQRASSDLEKSGGSGAGQLALYGGAAVRFVMVLILLGAGISILKLQPVAMMLGFFTLPIAFVVMAKLNRKSETK